MRANAYEPTLPQGCACYRNPVDRYNDEALTADRPACNVACRRRFLPLTGEPIAPRFCGDILASGPRARVPWLGTPVRGAADPAVALVLAAGFIRRRQAAVLDQALRPRRVPGRS